MIIQLPVPPVPPAPHFDPNLILMNDTGPKMVLFIVIAALIATTIILTPLVRAFARRLEGKAGDAALRTDVERLRAQITEVDSLQGRLAELEERVDFTERLLAQTHDASGRMIRGESQ
jgi:Tfp pilus assembly protein PilO